MTTIQDHDDDTLRDILKRVRTIALVGATDGVHKDAHIVMRYMQSKGYRVIPVNPRLAGQTLLGERVYARLADIPDPIDMVDIFRNSEAAGLVTDEAIAAGAKVVWMQLDVHNDAAADRATAAGLQVVMNRCPKIEYKRLIGEHRRPGAGPGPTTGH